MINRRRALDAGRALNEAAELYEQRARRGLSEESEARRMRRAARDANEIMFQYYLIPREIRERYHREDREERREARGKEEAGHGI